MSVTVTPDIVTKEGTFCGKCGVHITEGMWPFCPHPFRTGHVQIERDEIPGGMTCENYGPQPVTFYSHSERRAYMQAHGLIEKEKFCPMPGTDIDPQGIPNPKGYVDAQTLENGRVLLLRQQGPQAEEWDARKAGVLVGEFNIVATERDAKAFESGDVRRQARIGRRTDAK
jgi:hypothetical protein